MKSENLPPLEADVPNPDRVAAGHTVRLGCSAWMVSTRGAGTRSDGGALCVYGETRLTNLDTERRTPVPATDKLESPVVFRSDSSTHTSTLQ